MKLWHESFPTADMNVNWNTGMRILIFEVQPGMLIATC
jgi:hypothetical protein